MKTVEETRRELFEELHAKEVERLCRIYGAQPSLEVAYDRNEEGLYLSGVVQAAFWGLNAALDAVEIDLSGVDEYDGWQAVDSCRAAIESTNLGIKVK